MAPCPPPCPPDAHAGSTVTASPGASYRAPTRFRATANPHSSWHHRAKEYKAMAPFGTRYAMLVIRQHHRPRQRPRTRSRARSRARSRVRSRRQPIAIPTTIMVTALVTIIALARMTLANDAVSPGRIASAGVQEDHASARARLASMLATIQQVEGLVPRASIVPVIAILNQALDKLEMAVDPVTGGFTAQASANISAANAIMDAVEVPIAQLVAQASMARLTNTIGTLFAIAIACAIIVLLAWIKRRHDEKQLRSFLASEIDYTGLDGGRDRDEKPAGTASSTRAPGLDA